MLKTLRRFHCHPCLHSWTTSRRLSSLRVLNLQNRLVSALPADETRGKTPRAVLGAALSFVNPTPAPRPQLVAYSSNAAAEIRLPASAVSCRCTTRDAYESVLSSSLTLVTAHVSAFADSRGHRITVWKLCARELVCSLLLLRRVPHCYDAACPACAGLRMQLVMGAINLVAGLGSLVMVVQSHLGRYALLFQNSCVDPPCGLPFQGC